MAEVYYDLHIHTSLSPCADNDMTPNDIVSMAVLNKLDIIAITDHNSMANVESVIKASNGRGVTVLPGAEIETAEEVHVLCIFATLEDAFAFDEYMSPRYASFKNRKDIFGEQLLYNERDEVIGEVERMLLAATAVSFDELFAKVNEFGGAFIPAHINRSSNSVLSNLGFFPDYLDITAVEISQAGYGENLSQSDNAMILKQKEVVRGMHRLTSSDAHHIWDIAEREVHNTLTLPEKSASALLAYLKHRAY